MKSKILIVEDDVETAGAMQKALSDHGYQTTHAPNGAAGLRAALASPYDVIIMDRMMPEKDGITVVQELRAAKITTPVLMVSALGQVDDRVMGLSAGGDDYLPKPYALPELLARVDALVRRNQSGATTTKLKAGDLEMDLLAREVYRGGKEILLQPREFRLLEYLVRHAGQVVTRTMLLEGVWDFHFDPQTNVIDVHISRLRQKIDKGFAVALLHTVRGAGYMIKTD